MKSQNGKPLRVDRRTTIKWLAATMVATNSACSSNSRFLGEEIPPAGNASLGVARAPASAGYGTDPDLLNPVVPWPRTMTAAQLETTAALCDIILPEDDRSPSASTVGVHQFIDEWISAPYEQQRDDRVKILSGLEWLEIRCQTQHGHSFVAASEEQATELLDGIAMSESKNAESNDLAEFFDRFRFLAVGAFYTTETGIEDIGYIGNVPISGDYPGPSDEAMTHLAGVLDTLGLSMPG